MPMRRWLLVLYLAVNVSPAWSLCIERSEPLPPVTLDVTGPQGQIIYHAIEQQLQYQLWTTASLTGKTFVLYHLAARHGIDQLNDAFIKELGKLPDNYYQLVVMLNIDDVFVGGSYFARKTFEQNARDNRDEVMFVLDASSTLREHWCINDKSSTVIVIGPDGQVLQAKDGALTTSEIQDYLQAIEQVARR